MVFQEPMTSLNPALTIGKQLAEGLKLHSRLDDAQIRGRCLDMLQRVQIADPERCLAAYPHEFSGGMRQRIMLARSEEHTSELQSLMRISYAVFCLKKQNTPHHHLPTVHPARLRYDLHLTRTPTQYRD